MPPNRDPNDELALLRERLRALEAEAVERRQAAPPVAESQYRMLANDIPDIIYSLDSLGNTVTVNGPSVARYGYREEEFIGKPFIGFIQPEDRGVLVQSFMEAIAVRRELTAGLEFRLMAKDGRSYWCELHARARFDAQGSYLGEVGVLRDITERKLAEEALEKLQAQLYQAQKMESVGRLAGGVAHDFNNMLGIILGHVELAMEQAGHSPQLCEDLGEIRSAANRSATLTRQLLAFARKQTIAPEVLDLNATVGGMLKLLRRLIGEDIALVWEPDPDLWAVRVDPSQIDQILANLCVNARDAIPGVGTVTITTGNYTVDGERRADHGVAPGDYVRVSVADTGSGMSQETLTHLFEPFFTTKEAGKGTGLGLATVYGIVKQNHGFIHVESAPGEGTTLTLYLPRHAGEPSERAARATAPDARGNETILVVEDDPSILKMTARLLEQLGYSALTASSPAEAMRLARERTSKIHLLMLDVIMPEMNGRDLGDRLLTILPGVKRLFMSGYTADIIGHQGVLDEGVIFLQKPFSRTELATKVRRILDDAASS